MNFTTVADIVGKMRHRIQIIQLVKATDSDYGGQKLTTTSTHATVWAAREVKEIGSGESIDADQKVQVNSVNWQVRYLSTITSDMLILHENLYYDILSVLPDNTNTYMLIESKQRGPNWDQTVT